MQSSRALWTDRLGESIGSRPPFNPKLSTRRKPPADPIAPFRGLVLGIDPSVRGTGLAVLECHGNTFRYLASSTPRRIFARRLKTGGLDEVPGGAVLMTIHRVVEVFERRLPLVLALCTPGLVEAERDAANGAEYQQAVAVAHAAGISAGRDIEPVVAGFNAPVIADDQEYPQSVLRGHGEATDQQRGFHAVAAAMLALEFGDLAGELHHRLRSDAAERCRGRCDPAQAAFFEPTAVDFFAFGCSARWRGQRQALRGENRRPKGAAVESVARSEGCPVAPEPAGTLAQLRAARRDCL